MLIPKRVKRRRQHRGTMKGKATKGNVIAYGEYGLVSEELGWIKSNQIEAARIAMTRFIKRGGKVWIDIFPHKPITKKPAETRMGSGKGNPEYFVAVVKPGRVMFEIAGVSEEVANGNYKNAIKLIEIAKENEKQVTELQGALGVQKIYISPEQHKSTEEHIETVINDQS